MLCYHLFQVQTLGPVSYSPLLLSGAFNDNVSVLSHGWFEEFEWVNDDTSDSPELSGFICLNEDQELSLK